MPAPARPDSGRCSCAPRAPLPDAAVAHFADLVADAASPIDDVRGSARYRVHSLSVMARRALAWAWTDYQRM